MDDGAPNDKLAGAFEEGVDREKGTVPTQPIVQDGSKHATTAGDNDTADVELPVGQAESISINTFNADNHEHETEGREGGGNKWVGENEDSEMGVSTPTVLDEVPSSATTSDSHRKEEDCTEDPNSAQPDGTTQHEVVDAGPVVSESESVDQTSASTDSTIPISQSKGAQILMSRWNDWRASANQHAASLIKAQSPVLEENAKNAQVYFSKFSTRFSTSSGRPSVSSTVSDSERDNCNEITSATLSPKEGTVAVHGDRARDNINNVSSGGGTVSLIDAVALSCDEENDGTDELRSAGGGDESNDDSEEENDDVSCVEASSVADTDQTMSSATNAESAAYTRERMRAVLSRASVAGSVMAETMATGFRGRYTGDIPVKPAKEEYDAVYEPSPESQMELIMKSRAAEHMQGILNKLEDYEYAMLLGRGMLGVNLKQCFLRNHGIFVDYLVKDGQAQTSGLIRPGDLMVRLGESDFRKGTIKDIPLEIAQAKRPSILVMATGTKVSAERVNYVDIAVALMHRSRHSNSQKNRPHHTDLEAGANEAELSSREGNSSIDHDSKLAVEETEKEEKTDGHGTSLSPSSFCTVTIPVHEAIDYYRSPPGPSLELQKEFADESPLRCFDKFNVPDLRDLLDVDRNFRAALRNAFMLCALDSRRLPFLSKHFSSDEMNLVDDGTSERETPIQSDDSAGSMAPSAQMMLFLELSSFLDLYDVTPVTQLRESAKRIAFKFFLPTKVGTDLQPPLFDFHHIVPDSSLRHLEAVLNGKSKSVPRDLFLDFQRSVVDTLSASPFLSFLASSDCSRMRAHLRNTAPYVNLSLKSIISSITESNNSLVDDHGNLVGAKNYFAYILLYLICRMEKDAIGEYDFGLEKERNRRLFGAPNDLCCVVFIQRSLIPTLQNLKKVFNEWEPGEASAENDGKAVILALEQFWDLFIADNMDATSRPNGASVLYERVRATLSKIAEDSCGFDCYSQSCLEIILKSTLLEDVASLQEELLLEYASTIHSKFREHKFHEWMCNELCNVSFSTSKKLSDTQASLPMLPQGCLKRLLRKAELPESVSLHKPYQVKSSKSENHGGYHNADWAVVFGSSVGPELASQMPAPGLNAQDVRRYTCLPVAPDGDVDYDDFRPEAVLPATFESYAVVPPSKSKLFPHNVEGGQRSVDGWGFSLVTFTIPNAESSTSGDDAESSLYGVSLCLNRIQIFSSGRSEFADDVDSAGSVCIDPVEQRSLDSSGATSQWVSPIQFEKMESDQASNPTFIRRVNVSEPIPTFSSFLKRQPWVERIQDDQYRDQSNPLVIGIALVSRRNVVLSMRETLSRLLLDYGRAPDQPIEDRMGSVSCNALANLLGAFSFQNHEGYTLKVLLEPYIRQACSRWVDRPLSDQCRAFETFALAQLTDSLPTTPLALMFITALLEQKIILSSSRRSILHAAATALASLLRPLKWSHLFVPLVPGALAADLIQYPAPFILGVPSEDADNMDLLGNLPRDVTLVDLDVGRVILAPSFGQDNEMVRNSTDSSATARALRSQVLFLAQGLGSVFGNSIRPRSWQCDVPSLHKISGYDNPEKNGLERLRIIASSFIMELLEGSTSCCYWIEESMQNYGTAPVEPNVLFDEDKFFEIKHHRASNAWRPLFMTEKHRTNSGSLALAPTQFNLLLESFLRCQSVSLWISSRPQTSMLYY